MRARVVLVSIVAAAGPYAGCACEDLAPVDDGACDPAAGDVCPTTTSGGGPCVGCVCEPGEQMPCYSGPDGTKDVGPCAAGVQTCAPDGISFGVCEGETAPAVETCITNADEDCDGLTLSCGEGVWAKQYGGADIQRAWDVDSDADGRLFVVGDNHGTIDFGCGTLDAASEDNGFIAKLDENGYCVWSRPIDPAPLMPSPGNAHVHAVVVDPSGDAFVTGDYYGSLQLGPSLIESASSDVFIAKISSDGTWLWAKGFGNSHTDSGSDLGVDPMGDVVVVGHQQDTIDFGGGPIGAGANVAWVLKLDGATGDHLWSHAFPGAHSPFREDMAIDPAGNVVFVFNVETSVDLGGGPLPHAGQVDLALVKLDAGGNHVWSKSIGAGEAEQFTAVAIGPAGDIWASGRFAGTTDFGLGPHTALGDTPANPYDRDAFVLHFDPHGTLLSSRNFGASAVDDSAEALAVDPAGGVLISGLFNGQADLENGQPPMPAGMYLMRLDDSADTVWVTTYGNGGDVTALERDSAGRLFMTGIVSGQLDFGSDVLMSSPLAMDAFVARLSP